MRLASEAPAPAAPGSPRAPRCGRAGSRRRRPRRTRFLGATGAAATAVVLSASLAACQLPTGPGPGPSSSPSSTPPPPPVLDEAALKTAQELTVRIENVTCGADVHVGSGFLIDPDHAVTAYHVVEGAREPLAVRPSFAHSDSSISSGTVIGWDPTNDVALLQLKRSLDNTGRGIAFADETATKGQSVHEIGYPFGEPKLRVDGTVTKWAEHVAVKKGLKGTRHLPTAFYISAESRPGNSGGPVVDDAGNVLGLLDAGPKTEKNQASPSKPYGVVVPATAFRDELTDWMHPGGSQPLAECEQDDPIDLVTNASRNPDAASLRVFLDAYLGGINDGWENGDENGWQRAYGVTAGSLHPDTLDDFVAANYGSDYSDVTIHCVDTISSTTDDANVTYQLEATNENGETATSTVAVVLRAENKTGFWKFTKSTPFDGTALGQC